MLEIRNLKVLFHTYAGEVQAVRGINLRLEDGDTLAVVGESGCGKSVTAQSILQLHDQSITSYADGEILLDGKNLLEFSDEKMQEIRGREISMVFQDPMTSLNPTMTVGNQIIEVIRKHEKEAGKPISREKAWKRATELLRMVRLPNPEQRMKAYPHEFSGGQRQRVMIAIAMACTPRILIADEPTTALDVTVQAQILRLMKELQEKNGMSIMIITHDMGVVAHIAKKVAVMYGGLVVESGTAEDIFYNHEHPYTLGLLASVPQNGQDKGKDLESIEGTPPELVCPPAGCPFADRCPYAMQVCKEHLPEETVLSDSHRCSCWLLDPDCPYPRLSVQKLIG